MQRPDPGELFVDFVEWVSTGRPTRFYANWSRRPEDDSLAWRICVRVPGEGNRVIRPAFVRYVDAERAMLTLAAAGLNKTETLAKAGRERVESMMFEAMAW